ncbi:MAG TPA: glycosyltransferase, partial [Saprospiraceae bacterium]|nr:glycosyltransferase [Saprospiraceae bacterium]
EAYEASPYRSDIQLLGYVAEQELPELLGSALALTYVSLFEGFGLPILEALHAEVPVITSDRSSMPEVAGAAALLVDPESVDSIAQAMQGIWIEPALRQNLIATGRVQREKYSWAETIRVVYEQLISIKALI